MDLKVTGELCPRQVLGEKTRGRRWWKERDEGRNRILVKVWLVIDTGYGR
jgi:hypothetical protein